MSEHPRAREHGFSISAEHPGPFDCALVYPNRSEISDVTPYTVAITNDRDECGDDSEVYYSINGAGRVELGRGATVRFTKTNDQEESIRLWFDECFRSPSERPRAEHREHPKTPRVTLTLTKRGDD